ncbi:MAG: hypothetical protein AB4426_08760 [Xenococcaceae cyanobacterium]
MWQQIPQTLIIRHLYSSNSKNSWRKTRLLAGEIAQLMEQKPSDTAGSIGTVIAGGDAMVYTGNQTVARRSTHSSG